MVRSAAEKVDSSLPMDIILPAQFFSPPHSGIPDPERRLRLAMLRDALRVLSLYRSATDRRGRLLHQEAADWFASETSEHPFAFENVCDVLRLDPEYIRRGLRQWQTDGPSRNRRLDVGMQRLFVSGRPHKIRAKGGARRAA